MQLNCKVKKSGNPPISTLTPPPNPPFQGYPSFLAKFLVAPTSDSIFGVLDGRSSQEYKVINGVPWGFIFGPTIFLLYINDLLDYFICNIAFFKKTYSPFLWMGFNCLKTKAILRSQLLFTTKLPETPGSMLMILFSTLSVNRHLICGNN